MYWTVMGLFTLVEFVFDTFVFWFPLYYEIKLVFVLWMILPQTQGSIYLYQTVVDPYLSQHEHDIDKALKEMQTQTMAMGMRYIRRAIQLTQDLVLDFVRKSQSQAGASFLSDQDAVGTAPTRSEPIAPHQQETPTTEVVADQTSNTHSSTQGYFAWAYHAVATMASQTVSRSHPSRPLPDPPMDIHLNSIPSTGDLPASSHSGTNTLGISSSLAVSATQPPTSLRNRMISLYDDYETHDPKPYTAGHSAHSSVSSWSSLTGHGSPHSPAGDY